VSISAIKANPFYQPSRQWQIRIFVEREMAPAMEETFEDIALATSIFEINEAASEWVLEILTETSPEALDMKARIALVSGLLAIPMPRFEISLLEPKDWVIEVERSFTPLHIGRFYVHGSHVGTKPPQSKIALQVNAGAAFGSGEHATTSGCLLALSNLAKRRKFLKPLDMGCGSGILAIAMGKLWNVPVIGTDIDPVSIDVARGNALRNQAQTLSQFAAGDGYNCNLVRRNAPFDLIVANILARPLMKMAPDLAANLAPGGIAVLSGLLQSQERMVLSAHHAQGLTLLSRIHQNGWSVLVLTQ